jgi:hypothetical protein
LHATPPRHADTITGCLVTADHPSRGARGQLRSPMN